MQFVINGPDIPDALLQAHEEGRVVFFCGAGISYPAGLPGFSGLVQQIYSEIGTAFTDIESRAFGLKQFDATLDLLERRLPGQRLVVRRALANALKPKLRRKNALSTHAALLKMARSRDGAIRLVTTNFDRVFHSAANRAKQKFQAYVAPMLPVPKNSRWDGVVYLHGLLPEYSDDAALNRLVVTSGDFGLAYLTERWAARFVSELFRNYIVCFVGYSINDPVLRYMMDALAADRMLGEVTPQAWAIGDCEPGRENENAIEWKAKGVTPILYQVPPDSYDHSALHRTLQVWSDTYRDGVLGKERIVVSYALANPSASTQQDDFVGRMLWALSDKSGLPAKRFADFNPTPPLDWLLHAFADERFEHADLSRFGVPPRDEIDSELRFSLVRRPASYSHAPPMLLVSGGQTGSSWDDILKNLARWTLRYLDDPKLLIWVARRGGQLHDIWARLINSKLDHLMSLERDENTADLQEIRSCSPNAIPRPTMRILWRLVLSGRVKSPTKNFDLYSWWNRLQRDGLTTIARLELRDLLAPCVSFKQPFQWWGNEQAEQEADDISRFLEWELVLAADHVSSLKREFDSSTHGHWISALPLLLEDFQQLLRDALDVLRDLGKSNDRSDDSYWYLPSISPHSQNHGFHDWVTLIEFLRDAWLAFRRSDDARANLIALAWFDLPYPTFKRLALFAASQDGCIAVDRWVEWLLSDGAWWLWSADTSREVFRLFTLQGNQLTGNIKDRLEKAVLIGPPYRDHVEPRQWERLVARSVWLRLAKLHASGIEFGEQARERLASLSDANPKWQLSANEREEFSHWLSSSNDPDWDEISIVNSAPRKRQELCAWLKASVQENVLPSEDSWREVCVTRLFHCLGALCDLAREGLWPSQRWREALQAWNNDGMALRSWRYAAPLVQTMPDNVFEELARSVASWIVTVSKSNDRYPEIFLALCNRILALPLEPSTGMTRNGEPINRPVTEAINHPVGVVTQALLNFWFRRNPNDNDQLPNDIEPLFTKLCDASVDRFRHARVLFGSRLIAFFRVDRSWTEQHLLPVFDWANPEAHAVWDGFLWSPRLYQPLLIAIKTQFLDTAYHYTRLSEYRQQFASFLAYVALGPISEYQPGEFRLAFAALPKDGLENAIESIVQILESAAGQREEFWQNRVLPFWRQVWPKNVELVTPEIADSLARLSIAARSAFPAALSELQAWLRPVKHPHHVVHSLQKSGLCDRFPKDALRLLHAVIGDQQWIPKELGSCLDAIVLASPKLERDWRFQMLRAYEQKG